MAQSLIAIFIVLVGVLDPQVAFATMSSTNYQIQWDTISTGGSDSASSSSYQLRDTVGGLGIGASSSTTYDLRSGYRQGVNDQAFRFDLVIQDNSSQATATVLSGTTVTVGSVSGYASGDYILLIQDQGASQVAAIGRLTGVTATTLTVDAFTNGGTAPSIDGTGDFVYELTTSAAPSFGGLSTVSVSTTAFGWEVTNISQNGHTIYVFDDGNLRSGSNDIDDVTDGAIIGASEEYGARSSDTSLTGSTFDTADTAITTSAQMIGTEASDVYENRGFLTLKAAISAATVTGTYTTATTVIATGNF